ncbi:MAG: ABC transporter ATP-binding protein [Chloroflexi bacterium]|nr:ABC transporter ATP-binding protein [Chloroflexota bacterium]
MTAVGTPAVDVRGLSHRYASTRADEGDLLALADVDLTLGEGEFVSLVGPSGCGKTTLLRIVAGLLAASDGAVLVHGRAPAEARSDHALGLVTQDPGLLPWRSVAANVRLALDVTGRDTDIDALLALVGIERFARYHPRQLSGGMRQRVALARALAHEPRLLLLDEPFGALDELAREQMRLELLRIWEQRRISVLFVTHSIREAVLLSDRVVVMSGRPGRVVDDVRVPLPRPRVPAHEEAPEFSATAARVRAALAAGAP